MEMLEQNEIEKLARLGCDPIFDMRSVYPTNVRPCGIQYTYSHLHGCLEDWCKASFFVRICDGKLVEHLTTVLTACGGEFYIRCPGFEQIEKYWPEFDPAVEAAKLKEQALHERIKALESKVQELDLKKKG